MATKSNKVTEVTGLSVMKNVPDVTSLVETIDSSWLEGIDVEQMVSLDEGQGVRGKFLGAGPLAEVNDIVTGEVREVDTYRIELRPGVVVRLMGSHQLKTEFKTMPAGTRVRVMKRGQINTRSGRRVNQFIVARERDE